MVPARSSSAAQDLPEPAGTVTEEPVPFEGPDTAGDPACLAHLVCPSCGGVMTEDHQSGCDVVGLGLGDEPG